ncbi:unnamed protein product, partial [Rotaria sp. Silwood1]
GAVVRSLSKMGKFKIRCLTRYPTSEKARKLQSLSDNIEIFQCNIRNKDDLLHAFQNSWAIFAMTDFWATPTQPEIEIEQGKLMADIAAKSNIKYFIFSCAINVNKLSDGKLNVPQFSDKAIVREYISQTYPEMKTIYVMPSFYLQNWTGSYPLPIKKLKDGTVEFSLPMSLCGKLHNVDIDDLGLIVSHLLQNPENFIGQEICVCGEEVEFEEFVRIFTRVTGRQAQAKTMTEHEFRQWAQHLPENVQNYLLDMFKWMEVNGCYIPEINWRNGHVLTKLNTFETWLIKSGWMGPD